MLDGIIFRMRSGCQWNRLPRELGDDSTIHRTFQRWVELGVLTAHVLVDPDYPEDLESLRRRLQHIVYQDFGIDHITIQIEQSLEGCTERHHFDHLLDPTSR